MSTILSVLPGFACALASVVTPRCVEGLNPNVDVVKPALRIGADSLAPPLRSIKLKEKILVEEIVWVRVWWSGLVGGGASAAVLEWLLPLSGTVGWDGVCS